MSRSKESHESSFNSNAQGSLANCTQSCKYHSLPSKQEQKWTVCILSENESNGWNFTLFFKKKFVRNTAVCTKSEHQMPKVVFWL